MSICASVDHKRHSVATCGLPGAARRCGMDDKSAGMTGKAELALLTTQQMAAADGAADKSPARNTAEMIRSRCFNMAVLPSRLSSCVYS